MTENTQGKMKGNIGNVITKTELAKLSESKAKASTSEYYGTSGLQENGKLKRQAVNTSVERGEHLKATGLMTTQTRGEYEGPGLSQRMEQLQAGQKGHTDRSSNATTHLTRGNDNKSVGTTGNRAVPAKAPNVITASEKVEEDKGRVAQSTANFFSPGNVQIKGTVSKSFIRSGLQTRIGSGIRTYSRDAVHRTHKGLEAQSDAGTATIATAIDATLAGKRVFQGSQIIAPHLLKGTARAAKGTYTVAGVTFKIVSTAYAKANYGLFLAQSGTVKLNREGVRFTKAMVVKTAPVQKGIQTAKQVKAATENAKKTVAGGYTVVRGVLDGSVKIKLTPEQTRALRSKIQSGARFGGKGIKKAAKTGMKAGGKLGKTGIKGLAKGTVDLGNATLGHEDIGIQSMGAGIKTGEAAVHTLKATPAAVKTVVSVPIKTAKGTWKAGKGIYRAGSFIKQKGWKAAGQRAGHAVAKAGKSAVSAAIEGLKYTIKQVGVKVILPLLLICGLIFGAVSMTTAPMGAVGGIFGASFTMDGEDYEIHEYLMSVVPDYKAAYIQSIIDMCNKHLVENGGGYHYIRIFSDTNENPEFDTLNGAIADTLFHNLLYKDEEIANIIQAFYNIILLTEYNLEPTQEQLDETFDELWHTIFRITQEELPVEYCSDNPHACGSHHADLGSCPNVISGVHHASRIVCSTCCYRESATDEDGVKYSEYYCNGYYYCDGHYIMGVTVNMDGIYELLAKYFTEPIDQLSNLASRTPDQEAELIDLKDNYELCLAFLEEVQQNYGGGLNMSDLSGVEFIQGSRTGNQAIVDIALSQVGQTGGQPYWSWYGFDYRIEWCACFVSWCADRAGFISDGTIPKFCSCREGVNWFRSKGQWAAGNYTDLCPGDIIFFDWNGDGIANHVGVVIGTDGDYVYTVEGNSGDTCRMLSYSINSSVILGYGIPNY